MMISTDIEFFQVVYLKLDPDQYGRMVTKIEVSPGNEVIYQLSCGTVISMHFRQEFTLEKNQLELIK
jgi:hypothetical protein